MNITFAGSLSTEACELTSRVAELLAKNGNLEVSGWYFPEGLEAEPLSHGTQPLLENFDILEISTSRYSGKILSLYRQLMDRDDFAAHTAVALKLFNRRDFSGTFRLLEREVYLQNATLAALEYLTRKQPSLVIFPVTPHLVMPVVTRYVCSFLGIPVMFMQPCPLGPIAFPVLVEKEGERYVQVPDAITIPPDVTRIASRNLSDLAAFRDPTYMQLQRRRDSELGSLLGRIRSLIHSLRWLWIKRYSQSIDFSGIGSTGFPFWSALQVIFARSLQKNLSKRARELDVFKELPDKYCLFALHYEPERTCLPDGLPVFFQSDAVAAARAIVPEEMTLIVKEHYSQTSSALRGFLGRSPKMYDLLRSYRKVEFAPTNAYLSDIVDRASSVFTLTGTIAIESVLKGVPVAYFGSPWWKGMPGTIRIKPNTVFADISSTPVPTPSQVIQFLEDRVAEGAIVSLGSESVRALEKRLGKLPENILEAEALAIAELVRSITSGS